MKKTVCKSIGLLCLIGLALGDASVQAKDAFRLVKNDVVAFLGGANMVYLQKAGYLESILTQQFADAAPKFRDLAWEADTVFQQGTVIERWREHAHFDEDGGLGNLNDQLNRIGATVVISQFGQSESLEGAESLEASAKSNCLILFNI